MPNDDSASSDPDPDPHSSSNSTSGNQEEFAGDGSENNNANTEGNGGATNATASSSGNGDGDSAGPSEPFVYPAAPGADATDNEENFEDENPLIVKEDEDDAEDTAAAATPNSLTDDPMIKPLIIFIVVCTLLAVIIFPILFKVVLPSSQKKDDNVTTNAPAPSPTSNPIATPVPTSFSWVVDLPESWTTRILTEPTSSIALAYQWLAEDPNLPTFPMEQRKQRLALAGLYFATKGANWYKKSNWMAYLGPQSECSWEGVICGGGATPQTPPPTYATTPAPNSNTTMALQNTSIPTNITSPPTIVTPVPTSNSTSAPIEGNNATNIFDQGAPVRYLRRTLQGNNITMGPIVTAFATAAPQSFESVQFLDLSSNNLNGSLPEELSLLTDLQILDLKNNMLSGSIPSLLFESLVNLQEVNFYNNQQLTGNLPTTVGKLSVLALLDLSSNQLQGSLPTELGFMVFLQRLIMRNNRFNSILPNITIPNLQVLDLGQNNLTGPIPAEWTQMKSLKSLLLDGNNLSGPIPPKVGPRYLNLKELNITGNPLLTGVVPDRFCYIDRFDFTCYADESLRLLCGCGTRCSCGDGISPLIPPGNLTTPASQITVAPSPASNTTISPTANRTISTTQPVGIGTADPAAQGTTTPVGIGTADPAAQATVVPAGSSETLAP